MATYYRWRKSDISYTDSTSTSSYVTFPINGGGGSIYFSTSKPSISNGYYTFSQAQFISDGDSIRFGASNYFASSSSAKTIYTSAYQVMVSRDDPNFSIHPINGDSVTTMTLQVKPGSTIGYVYSTSASAYPNGGISGYYYYDQRTSFNQSSQLTVPSVAMQGQNITVNWTSLPIATSYTLQRQSSVDSNWVQVYSGTALTFTEQVGNWTQVQYRVQTVYSGGTDSWVTSSSIPVSAPTTLVISGEDGDLGIITANVPYTISSNSSDTISLTRKVNQVEVASLSINSGFAYDIPIFDLPTGTNTIELTATVQTAAEGPVTDSRTWSYTKTPIQFVDTGGVAQLVQNGTNIWPITLSESVRVPTYLGGSLDKALQLLSQTSGFVVIAVGEYVGTGTYGQSNQNTLTFDSAPSMVLVYGDNETLIVSSPNTVGTAYIQGNQAKWYSTTSAEDQMNSSGITYNYIAVGKSS